MHITFNCPCTGGFAVPAPLGPSEIASGMFFRGYVKLGEASPGIIRQLSIWVSNKILKVTV